MKMLLFLFCLFVNASSKAQSLFAVGRQNALNDIQQKQVKLLLIGGEAPVVQQGQEHFERQYGLQYHDYGCISPEADSVKAYNKTIFSYLDATYGKQWRREVRNDVLGLKG
jgi:hypothetical protein